MRQKHAFPAERIGGNLSPLLTGIFVSSARGAGQLEPSV
jgi:hypothetical protein